jgi:hypothetical protein
VVLGIAAPAIAVSALASPSPSPAPAKNARLTVYAGVSLIYVTQSASGPGAVFPRTLGSVPIAGFPLPPRYTGTRLVIEQRFRLGENLRQL